MNVHAHRIKLIRILLDFIIKFFAQGLDRQSLVMFSMSADQVGRVASSDVLVADIEG